MEKGCCGKGKYMERRLTWRGVGWKCVGVQCGERRVGAGES